MPRKARPQRTDLNATKVTVPGQDYGKQAEQRRAMAAVPTVNMQQQLTAMEKAAAPLEQQGAAPMMPTQQAPAGPPIGDMPFLHPTTMPDMPMTHGLSIGPGAGPEALGPIGNVNSSIAEQLHSAATGPYGTPQLNALADIMKSMGF